MLWAVGVATAELVIQTNEIYNVKDACIIFIRNALDFYHHYELKRVEGIDMKSLEIVTGFVTFAR